MTTKSAEILAREARYKRVEHVTDALGRTFGVRRLKPSQQVKVQEWAPGLDGVNTVVDENPTSPTYGKSFNIPKILPLIQAAAVCEVDGNPIPFANNRLELDSIMDMLDGEGFAAVTEGLAKLHAAAEAEAEPADPKP